MYKGTMYKVQRDKVQKSKVESQKSKAISRKQYNEKSPAEPDSFVCVSRRLFLLTIAVTRHEFIYATSGIHEFGFTGIERVAGVGDFKFDKRIFFAINLNGVFSSSGRTAEELRAVRHVFENYNAVVIWMNSLFHKTLCFLLELRLRRVV